MSKMPTDRNTDWQKIFDRFGSLDGALRQKSTAAKSKSASKTDSEGQNDRPSGSVSPPTAKVRRASE